MNYELAFYCLLAFIVGRAAVNFRIYIGRDKARYEAATIGILLGDKE